MIKIVFYKKIKVKEENNPISNGTKEGITAIINKPWTEAEVYDYNIMLNNHSINNFYTEKDCKISILNRHFELFTPQEYQKLLNSILDIKVKQIKSSN